MCLPLWPRPCLVTVPASVFPVWGERLAHARERGEERVEARESRRVGHLVEREDALSRRLATARRGVGNDLPCACVVDSGICRELVLCQRARPIWLSHVSLQWAPGFALNLCFVTARGPFGSPV